jgi:fused signal recognition particle receptor
MLGIKNLPGLSTLKAGLAKTRDRLARLMGRPVLDEAWFEEVESALILADAGGRVAQEIVSELRASLKKSPVPEGDADGLSARLSALLATRLSVLAEGGNGPWSAPAPGTGPRVIMMVGVNGAGKTTTVGKLAHQFQQQGQRVLLAAGDTFRAAAREQLLAWGDRSLVEVVSQTGGDPSAVAFDAIKAGQARGAAVVLVDTAGRLPTQLHLMEELKKIKRVMAKAQEGAPHEVWLVVDGGNGQNALSQVKAFHEALGLTGLIVTKLDGTAKGGVLLALAQQQPVRVPYIGVGEQVDDLQPFDPSSFADALVRG